MRLCTTRGAVFGTLAIAVVLISSAGIIFFRTGETGQTSSLSMDRAREIRKSAAREIDYAGDREALLDHLELFDQPASVGLELVRRDAGGFWCGGAAVITRKIFEEEGARSWTYNFGVLGVMTHVTTIVEVDGEIYVQDSYFNFEFVQNDGTAMPFPQVIASLEKGIAPAVLTERDYERDWVYNGTEPKKSPLLNDQYRIKGNHIIYRAPLTLDSIHESGFSKAGLDWLEERGYPRDLMFFMLFPLNVAGPGFKRERCISSACPRVLVELSDGIGTGRRSLLDRTHRLITSWLPWYRSTPSDVVVRP